MKDPDRLEAGDTLGSAQFVVAPNCWVSNAHPVGDRGDSTGLDADLTPATLVGMKGNLSKLTLL